MSTSKVFFKFAMENNVRYLSNQELEQTKVSFDKDGVVRQKSLDSKINDPVVMDNSDSYAFVIGKSGQQGNTSSLYMTEKKHGDKGIINHSSFFRGGKVKAAGMISTQQGKIVQVVNLSGHYKPTDVEMAATFKFLKTKMTDEDFNKIVYVSTDNKKQLAGSFLASYELNHPELQNDLSEDKPIQQPLSLEPLKQSTAVSKEPVSFQKFSREVQMRADAFAMKKLISGLEAEKSDASYELQKLTVSQNPVAKVGGPLFVPKITLKSPEANANNHTQALSKAMAQARLMKADGNAASLEMLMTPLKKYSGSNKNSPEAVALAKELVTQCRLIKDKIKNADRRSPLKKENEAIKNLDEIIKSMGAFIDLEPAENMKTFYNKDELVSQLQLNQNFTESLEDKGKVADVIRIVKAETGTFITLSDNLKNILDQNSIKLSNLNEYASTVEFMKANSANEIKAADVIKNAVKVLGIQESTFAFKTGSENVKELLAGKLTSALTLATFLAPKEEHKMENASLSGQINPRGIASRFLDDSTNFSTSEWEAVLQVEHELAVAEFHLSENPQDKDYQEKVLSLSTKLAENKRALREKEFESTLPASFASLLQLKKATADLDNAKQALKKSPNDQKLSDEVVLKEQNLGGAKKKYNIEVSTLKDGFKGLSGVKEHVLTDLLFCAYDSHAGQYMVKNGSAFNIDFARFLAPCEVFERNGNLYPTLRTGLFDHPSSGEPLSANEIQKIQSWNIESIESQWKSEGLVGSSEAFKEADKKITEYFDDLDKASSVNYNIKDLCLKYDVKSENIQEGVLKKIVTDKIKQEMEGVREECFSQVHPEAFAAFKERVFGLQTYIKQCESENTPPTLKGAFPLMYPNMAPFMKVMERLEVNPGSGISFAIKDGTMIQRSLTSIINDAKKANLVSEDEIKEMQSAIESYQKIDARKTSLQTTMSLR